MGGMTMRGWRIDPLAADAVASIAAISFARARAIQMENRAEVERDAERLRTAVLDGLAHGFKTPLTAIKTASSGLLAIDCLSATQLELVSIIDERATMLSQLTTGYCKQPLWRLRKFTCDVRIHRLQICCRRWCISRKKRSRPASG